MRILLLLLLLPTLAFAGKTQETPQAPQQAQIQGQAQLQSQAQSALALGGSASLTGGSLSSSVEVDNDTKMPASSANSPSVGTMNDCQIATPSSKAFSVLLFSVSGTTGVTYNDLCFAYKTGQLEIAEQLMCQKSQDYAKVNPRCKK